MIKLFGVAIWGVLTAHTIITGTSSVLEQSIAQFTLFLVILISAIRDI